MNVLRPEEMSNLESILLENPNMKIRDFNHFKGYEITYLKRARRLPMDTINYAIKLCESKNLGKKELIKSICETFGISEKEAENRLREVKRINKYNLDQKTLEFSKAQ